MIAYKTFKRLDFKTRYFIRVRAKLGDNVGRWLEPPLDHTTIGQGKLTAPANVNLDFDTVTKDRHSRYRCKVTWDRVYHKRDVDGYRVELWRWDNDNQLFLDDEPAYTTFVDHDPDRERQKAVFFPVRKRYYRARVRTVLRDKRSDWSSWSPPGSPADEEATPPRDVKISVTLAESVVVQYTVGDPDDTAYFQVQISQSPNFSSIYMEDVYHLSQSKTFKIPALDRGSLFYGRVRTVDGSGNKSSWIPATVIGNSSPNATPDGVMPSAKPPTPTNVKVFFSREETTKTNPWTATTMWNEISGWWQADDGNLMNGVSRYVVQLAVSDDGGATVKNIRRKVIEAADDDSDLFAWATWTNISRKYWYRARVRAVDALNRRSDWSEWSSWERPAKNDAVVRNLQWLHPRPRVYKARWDPPEDDDGVIGYRVNVYRDNVLVETSDITDLHYRYDVPATDKGKNHKVRVTVLYEGSMVENINYPEESSQYVESSLVQEGTEFVLRDDIAQYSITDTEIAEASVSSLVLIAEGCAVISTNDQLIASGDTTRVGFNAVEFSTPNFAVNLQNDAVAIDAVSPSNNGVYMIMARVRFSPDSNGRRRVEIEWTNEGVWQNLDSINVPAVTGATTDVILTWVGRLNVIPGQTRIRVMAYQNSGTQLTLLAAGKRLFIGYLGAPQFTPSPPASFRVLGRRT